MKNKKLIGLASLMLVLGAVGCGGDKCKDGHTWGDYEIIKAATCTEAGEKQRTCTVCGEKDEVKSVAALKHDWKDDATGAVESTCTVKGKKGQTCSRCGAKQEVETPLKAHTWVDIDGGTPATCTEAGTQKQRCSVCGQEQTLDVAALNHDYGDEVVITAPECEKDGLNQKTCKRCGHVEDVPVGRLNHDFQPVGGEPEPGEGEAMVRVYKCANCQQTSLGFNANEPSTESKKHLVIGDDGGARFFGRPIGNSLALDAATGDSVNRQDGECVYSSKETGDFFEYVFTLNAEQARALASCRCYCDAKPADHLNTNDFWAYASSAEDWTSGFYIDDDPAHKEVDGDGNPVMVDDHEIAPRDSSNAGDPTGTQVQKGKRITDYRYVLYVDDPTNNGELKIQQFDAKTKVPCEGNGTNMKRKEYVMPYTFKLHEGQNKISLRMAGGYRSVFYKFTFRPYEDPTDIAVANENLTVSEGKTVAIEGISETGVTFKSNNEAIATVDANGVVTGVKEGSTKIIISKEGNYRDAEVNITVGPREGTIVLNLTDAVIAPAEGGIEVYNSSSSGQWYRNPKNGTTLTYNFQSEVAGKFDIKLGLRNTGDAIDLAASMGIKVNDADVTVTGSVKTSYDPVEFVVGQADLKVGANTMVISFPADSALYIKTLKLAPAVEVVVPPTPVHEHAWTAAADPAQGENDAVVKKYTCECGKVKYEIASKDGKFQLDGSSKWKDDASNPTKGDYFKLKTDGDSFHFTFALPKAFSGQMYQRGYMDSYSSNKSNKLYYARGVANIAVTVNGATDPIAMTGAYPTEGKPENTYEDVLFSDVFGTEADASGNSPVKDVLIGNIELATSNTITYKRVKTVNLTVSALVFIGTEAA